MTLTELHLKNFRSYHNITLPCHPEFNFIYGKNAQGKTNLIEAIYYLSALKSFRTSEKLELIHRSANFAHIGGKLMEDGLTWDLAVTLSPQGRQIRVNDKPPPARHEYHALLPIILFEPRHIYLFRDAPAERRRYLNRALFLKNPATLALVHNYEKTLAQKNRLLKDRAPREQIAVWNEKLATLGSEITFERHLWCDEMNAFVAAEYRSLSGATDLLQLRYRPSVALSGNTELTAIHAQFHALLNERFSEEVDRRESLVGPHRDDWSAFLDERDVGKFASQGENRSVLIAVKLAQLKAYTARHGKTPLFLLDDVASELDENRCQYLFSYLCQESAQVFLTTTENRLIHERFQGRSQSFLIEHGTPTVLV